MHFEEFLDAELDSLARYARAVSRDRNDAHDLLAESLIKVQKAWPKIVGAESQVAYVRRIITNTLISERRSWVARHIFTTRSGQLPDVPTDGATARIETRDALDRLLRTLAPRERAAVVLRYYLGLDDRAIAEEMGCSVSSVRSYISRALGTLRITASSVQGWTSEVSRRSADSAVRDTNGNDTNGNHQNGNDQNGNNPSSKENRHG